MLFVPTTLLAALISAALPPPLAPYVAAARSDCVLHSGKVVLPISCSAAAIIPLVTRLLLLLLFVGPNITKMRVVLRIACAGNAFTQ